MITRKFALVSVAASLALASVVFAAGSASPEMSQNAPASPDRAARFASFATRKLQLTDAQRSQLEEIMRRHQPELQPLRAQARAERAALRDIIGKQPLDEAALNAQAARIAETTKALTIASAHMRAELRSILTPEQIDTLMQARRRAAEHRQHRRQNMDTRLSPSERE